MIPLADVLGPKGALAARLPGFTYRAAQQRMAELVWETLDGAGHCVIEAGTGIGKTFGYLVPVLLSGRRAIVSTGTKTLQDQLFGRDLPLLGGAIGRPASVALLKGRGNYLCPHRLGLALGDGLRDADTVAALTAVAEWGRASVTGDLTELGDLSEEHALRPLITSTVDNCLGGRCPKLDDCFVAAARRTAQQAQIVIVNHHLLLADLALKEGGFGELLPQADVVVVDEAHLLPDIAQQFFGVSLTTRELEGLAHDVFAEARAAGLGVALQSGADALLRAAADARARAATAPGGRLPWIAAPPRVREALPDCRGALEELAAQLDAAADVSEGLKRCAERCAESLARLRAVVADDEDGLRWFDVGPRSIAAHWTPLDIGGALAQRIEAQGGAWVFTSATLAVGEDFAHFLGRIGLEGAVTEVLASPFDYARNARLFIPQGLPEPADETHVERLMAAVWPLVEAAGGGAFLLFTSFRALNRAYEWVRHRDAPGPVLAQGAGPRSELLEAFRRAGNAVLLGTGSFWQGVDVRGPALRLVAIDKLPFAAPNDPLVQARVAAIRRAGGDAFHELHLPQAVLALKQGVGRLIRDFDDRGLVVLGDPRLRTRPYGRVFLESLPRMPLIEEAYEALEFAATLAPAREAQAVAP
ncbi:MAG TPA: ATP-dependent DNA helicase [Gammaproteobacteria bacterium]